MFLNLVPLLLVISYLMLSMLLFFAGPFDWPVKDDLSLLIFLVSVFFAIIVGYLFGIKKSRFDEKLFLIKKLDWKRVFKIGITASLVIFLPATYIYSNKFPWQFLEILRDQGTAYGEMLEGLAQENTGRKVVAFVRMIYFPWMFAIVPLVVLKWREMSKSQVGFFALFLFCQVIFSIMRGTDKEIADLMVLFCGAFLIKCGRLIYLKKLNLSFVKFFVFCLSIVFVLMIAFGLFSERKLSRLGSANEFCVAESAVVCADYSGPILSRLDDVNQFGIAMLAAYLSQGYYGLSIALNESFESTYGLGHSPVLISIYSNITGDDGLYERSFLYKMKDSGWDDKGVWSTMFPWIASDVGFPMTVVAMLFLSFLFSKSWVGAVKLDNDYAALVFVNLFLLFMYAPANNQLAQTADAYFGFWFWLIFWFMSKKKIIYTRID